MLTSCWAGRINTVRREAHRKEAPMKLLMEPLVVAAILMKELPDKQVGSAESAKDASAAPEVPARNAAE